MFNERVIINGFSTDIEFTDYQAVPRPVLFGGFPATRTNRLSCFLFLFLAGT